ncbi:hypothetical protein C7212DRAFT_341385 [Tuber magnatum]|uniref:WD40 repeat-like protein n=1 Tax=Tuber magnatum TaxID=42249 RepID=A0A317SVX3_9PEZI|nr:hypothetical protein C7212DRAFT_341382 [Tuber magnatum]PWW78650.1 hypothetical protein C7212DRAFT_341385 [Tuber magnatum]
MTAKLPVPWDITLAYTSTSGTSKALSCRLAELSVHFPRPRKSVTWLIQDQGTRAQLAVVALDGEGSPLATASDKGKIIKVFSIPGAHKLYQFRRGTYPSLISPIPPNLMPTPLCAPSATETVHIFCLGGLNLQEPASESFRATDSDSGVSRTNKGGWVVHEISLGRSYSCCGGIWGLKDLVRQESGTRNGEHGLSTFTRHAIPLAGIAATTLPALINATNEGAARRERKNKTIDKLALAKEKTRAMEFALAREVALAQEMA